MTSTTIDPSNPLYINPSDTPGLNLINEQLIGTDNYGIWSRAMLIALRAKNKLAFINGNCTKPDSGSDTELQWECCNALVLSWIMNAVSKEIFARIVYSTDAVVVGEDLRERFNKINGSRIFALHIEIGCHVQGNNSISMYYSKLRQLWDEYGSLVTLPSCSCETSKKYVEFDQQHKLLKFFTGLNDNYAYIRSHILMLSPLPTVTSAFAMISQEESHRNLSSVAPALPESVAFYSAQDKRKSNVRCEHCHWSGHSKENCFKLIGYPPGHRLHKGQGKGGNQKFIKEMHDKEKPIGKANASCKRTSGQ